jgi:hypothetical protein
LGCTLSETNPGKRNFFRKISKATFEFATTHNSFEVGKKDNSKMRMTLFRLRRDPVSLRQAEPVLFIFFGIKIIAIFKI